MLVNDVQLEIPPPRARHQKADDEHAVPNLLALVLRYFPYPAATMLACTASSAASDE
jgi:hypothetical protein